MKMMFYVDCSCFNHDRWRHFHTEQEARNYFNRLDCQERILYTLDSETGKFRRVIEKSQGREIIP